MTAALPDRRSKPLGLRHDEVIGLGLPGCPDDFLLSRTLAAVGNVFPDARGEEDRVLENHAYLGAERGLGQFFQIMTIKPHDTRCGIVEPGHQTQQGALAGARSAHESDRLTRSDGKVDSGQHGSLRIVGKGDAGKSDLALGGGDRHRVRCVLGLLRPVKNLKTALRPRCRTLESPGRVGKLLDGLVEGRQVSDKDEQITQTEMAVKHLQGSCPVQDSGTEHHEGAHDERTPHGGKVEPEVRLQALRGEADKLIHLERLTSESLHHTDRAKSLLRRGKQVALPFLDCCRFAPDPVPVMADRPDDGREDSHRHQRQLPVHPQHDHKGTDQRDHGAENGCKTLVVDRLDRLRIVGHAEGGVAAAACVVKT